MGCSAMSTITRHTRLGSVQGAETSCIIEILSVSLVCICAIVNTMYAQLAAMTHQQRHLGPRYYHSDAATTTTCASPSRDRSRPFSSRLQPENAYLFSSSPHHDFSHATWYPGYSLRKTPLADACCSPNPAASLAGCVVYWPSLRTIWPRLWTTQ